MHISALEDAALTQDTNEPQPELPAPPSQSDTQEQESPAEMPTEPDIIEGEVIVLDPPEEIVYHIPPKHKPYWLLIPLIILVCFSIVAVSLLVPMLSPSATVTILPIERSLTTTAAIQVQGRQVAPLTLSQSATVPATGKRRQAATRASGTITLYNGLLTSQTIAAGTVLTGSDGTQVVTDQPAVISAASPPIEGHITVPAHALLAGASGNIPAYDINQACCATSVLAKNREAFTSGAAAKDFLVVTRENIRTAASQLQATLSQSERAALEAQLRPNEQLIAPSCPPYVSSDHKPEDEATHVTVTASETCSGIAYIAHEVDANATQLLTTEALKRFGTGYSRIGDLHFSVLHAIMTDRMQGLAMLTLTLDATYVYTLTPGVKQHLVKLIAGKLKQRAIIILLRFPGIQSASMHLTGNYSALPADPSHIHLIVMYRSN